MMLTTKGRYAVMAILEMASNVGDEPITLNEISLKQNISLNYLEQIFSKLKKANLVKAIRGPNGGYILIGKLEEIKISNIMDAVNENFIMTGCYKKSIKNCASNTIKCNSHKLWKGLGKHIRDYFENISVKDALNLNLNI
ncbi:[Fe-S]-binding protein [Rickettsia bellii]|uniref:Iron-sulfur cluster assembly transcription factor IscR n=2 Tax=Rickettsia bellii TaxID=33990 RepID=Q1RHY4_RICBR|nr:Rrf2 family transcriptional regulator [Rickettsia bellii]ABE05030.1 Iron-sulfur cluster assembly transcription factor IscR [Rickettsia bellii RML369-C]ARD86986.1 [Fe-S]-binding protein [Rickettsia bellii]